MKSMASRSTMRLLCAIGTAVFFPLTIHFFSKCARVLRARDYIRVMCRCFWNVLTNMTLASPRTPTVTHCNTLQHTATHCNTLQHTATHCNTLQQTFHECLTWSFAMAFWTNEGCVHIMCATVMMCVHDVCKWCELWQSGMSYFNDMCTWCVQ